MVSHNIARKAKGALKVGFHFILGTDCCPVKDDFYQVGATDSLGGQYNDYVFDTEEEARAFFDACSEEDFSFERYPYGSAGFEEASFYDDEERARYGY